MSQAPRQVLAYDDVIRYNLEEFKTLSTELGAPMIEFFSMVKDAFDKSRQLIEYGLCNPAPVDASVFFQQHPFSKALQTIQNFRDANRKNAAFFNHLSMISESIMALNWFMIKPAPTQFVRDMKDAGQFYGNRVLVSNKGNATHTNWVNKWKQILDDVELYVKEHFLTGFTWGSVQGGMSQPGPPPPPPPPAPEFFADASSNADASSRQALLQDLNQGTAITSRLKSAKIPRGSGDVSSMKSMPAAAKLQEKKTYPPKFALEGRKWCVEHQVNNSLIKVDNEMSHSLAMYSCQGSYLETLNKINNIVIDNSKKTSIMIRGDVISCVEIIRCEGLKIQCEGVVPLISIDNSDNIQIFVSEKSKNVELIASKSSALNMCLMKPDGDYVEFPVPEQIRSVIENGTLKSNVVENI